MTCRLKTWNGTKSFRLHVSLTLRRSFPYNQRGPANRRGPVRAARFISPSSITWKISRKMSVKKWSRLSRSQLQP
ncbi:hypothetical protein PHJA_002270300 [Phtheirospermum japonicum]|uniref:Uncharacterized protein n=1 Tax=Phtheirospermum japonicum TaxID=374723 RepID=A0A830CZE4_9LAMI|nr:hypothetical protein PHJA_002270300 [Phtheirospermum japonicum]